MVLVVEGTFIRSIPTPWSNVETYIHTAYAYALTDLSMSRGTWILNSAP